MSLSPRHPELLRPVALLALLASVAVCPSIAAQVRTPKKIIRRIEIEGLKRESKANVLSQLKIRIGDVYDSVRASEETGNLYRTGKFRRVQDPQVSEYEDGVSITFVVEERPSVTSVIFRGRKQVSESTLTSSSPAIRTRAGGLLNEAVVRQDKYLILSKYLDDGYIFAKVDSEIAETGGRATVTFDIEEGSRVRIQEVKFSGNRKIPSSTLLGLMETREKGWLFGLIHSGFYSPETLEEDLHQKIEPYYRRLGFFDAKAQLEDVVFDAWKEKLTLLVAIREGTVYTFDGYELSGNAVFTDKTLLALTRSMRGKPFSQDALDKDVKAITDHYFNRAYIFAKVRPRSRFSDTRKSVKILLDIEENNEITIEEVRIRGNAQTRQKVIRRELEFYPGQKVDWSRFTESRSNLSRLGLFGDIRFTFEDGPSPEKKNVVVNFKEQRFGRLFLQFGLSSDLGVIGLVRIRKNNFDLTDLPEWPINIAELPSAFTGAGQTMVLELQPGTRYSSYRLRFVEPYVFGTRNALSLSLSSTTFRWSRYDEGRDSFQPRVSHAFSFDRDFIFSVGGRLERVEISHLDAYAPPDAFAVKGLNTVSALNTSVAYNKVLYEFLEGPFDGSNNAFFLEYGGYPLGGDVDFYKGMVTSEFYFPLYTIRDGTENYHHVFSIFNRFGVIEPHDDTESIPIFERFYLGGLRYGERVRGFDYRGIGPHQNGEPVGGTGLLFGNVEYSFPIFKKLLRGVVFFDYGNLSPTLDTFKFSEMRFSVGGGFRINFPLPGQPFPLAFYLGYPLRKLSEDETRVFLFSIGSPF